MDLYNYVILEPHIYAACTITIRVTTNLENLKNWEFEKWSEQRKVRKWVLPCGMLLQAVGEKQET